MRKIILSTAALLAAVSIQAVETPAGVFTGQVKAMHILSDIDNGYAPESGSGYLLTAEYLSPELTTGLNIGAALYVNGDTGLTEWDGSMKPAGGMFTDEEGKAKVNLGQAYLTYKNDSLHAKVGRQILNTPLTTIKWSLMPNFYEAAVVGTKVSDDTSLTLAHVSSMSYGSRAAADWGLIGEKTGTAGTARPMLTQSPTGAEQAKFINLGELAGTDDTSGITAVNVAYTGIKNLKLSLWDYYAHDIGNMIYADAAYKMPVAEGLNLDVNAQYLSQSLDGAADDYSLIGTKVNVGNKKYSAYIAYSMSGADAAFLNPWGSDPSYTSSLFSRNQYRQDVSAYKVGGHYVIMKGLKLMASHANYGQSKTSSAMGTPTTDATETDIILAYKPNKDWMLKIFNAIRVSEYDTSTTDKTMNHIRMIGSYNF